MLARTPTLTHTHVIHSQEGQRINLTLIDFGVYGRSEAGGGGGARHAIFCAKYADVQDGSRDQVTPICAGDVRVRNVYVSKSSTVRVTLERVQQSGAQFLIKWEGQ